MSVFNLSTIPLGSTVCIIGYRASGKSTLAEEICSTFHHIPRITVSEHSEYDDSILENIAITQESFIEKYGKEDIRSHMLLMLDNLHDKQYSMSFLNIFLNAKSLNITLIFTLTVFNLKFHNTDFIFLSTPCHRNMREIHKYCDKIFN